MAPRVPLALGLALALAPAWAEAQPETPSHLLRRQAPVLDADVEALVRLPLPPEVLAGAQAQLADVRLIDGAGEERPYLVDSGLRPLPADQAQPVPAVPRSVRRRRRPPGAGDEPRVVEVHVLEAPGPPPEGAHFALRVEASAQELVRRLTVEGGGRVLVEADLFRLVRPLRERMTFPLPAALPDRVTVTLEGEGTYLDPTFVFVPVRGAPTPPTLTVPLEVRERRSRDDGTELVLRRPEGLRPELVRVHTASGTFHRPVSVFDHRQGEAPRPIGAAELYRVELGPGRTAERLEVAVEPPRGQTLTVLLHDRDSGPLAELRVEAVVRQPALVFRGAGVRLLRFGGGRLRAPRYDLAGLVGGEAGDRLLAEDLPTARLGPVEDNPAFRPEPALAFAHVPGQPIETGRHGYRGRLAVEGAREGLARLVVPPAVLGRSRDDLADVRWTGPDGRQRAYLQEDEGLVAWQALEVSRVTEGSSSRFTLRSSVGPVPLTGLRLATSTMYLRRPFVLRRRAGDAVRDVAGGVLRRDPAAGGAGGEPAPVVVAVDRVRADELELEMTDGGDAPLEDLAVEARVPTPVLYAAVPDGAYTLWTGRPTAEPPDYDLGRARELVLAVPAADVEVRGFDANPAYRPPPPSMDRWATIALWAVLGLAILVLGALTWRVASTGGPEPPPTEGGPSPPERDDDPPDADGAGGEAGRHDRPVEF